MRKWLLSCRSWLLVVAALVAAAPAASQVRLRPRASLPRALLPAEAFADAAVMPKPGGQSYADFARPVYIPGTRFVPTDGCAVPPHLSPGRALATRSNNTHDCCCGTYDLTNKTCNVKVPFQYIYDMPVDGTFFPVEGTLTANGSIYHPPNVPFAGAGSEQVFYVDVPPGVDTFVVETCGSLSLGQNDFDTLVAVFNACPRQYEGYPLTGIPLATVVGWNDDAGTAYPGGCTGWLSDNGFGSAVSTTNVQSLVRIVKPLPGRYWILLDGVTATDAGDYALFLTYLKTAGAVPTPTASATPAIPTPAPCCDECYNLTVPLLGKSGTQVIDLFHLTHKFTYTVASGSSGTVYSFKGPEVIFVLDLATPATQVTFSTCGNNTATDTVIAAFAACPYIADNKVDAGEIAWNDDDVSCASNTYASTLTMRSLPAGRYYVLVDSLSAPTKYAPFRFTYSVTSGAVASPLAIPRGHVPDCPPTPVPSVTPTRSPSASATVTRSASTSATGSASITGSASVTATVPLSASALVPTVSGLDVTPSDAVKPSGAAASAAEAAASTSAAAASPSVSAASTSSSSSTVSVSSTLTASASGTDSSTPMSTVSSSGSATPSTSATASASPSFSRLPTRSPTGSGSSTAAATASASSSRSGAPTASFTGTATPSASGSTSPSPLASVPPWSLAHEAWPPAQPASPCSAATETTALAPVSGGRLILSPGLPASRLRLLLRRGAAGSSIGGQALQVACTSEVAANNSLPSCLQPPQVSFLPSSVLANPGIPVELAVTMVSGGGLLPSGAGLCEAALRCVVGDAAELASTLPLTELAIPLLIVPPRLPLLDDVVLEHVPRPAVSASAAPRVVSLKSLWGPWNDVDAAGDDAVSRAAAAFKVSAAAQHAASVGIASLSLLTAGNASATLISSPVAALGGVGLFAAPSSSNATASSPSATTVALLTCQNGTTAAVPLLWQGVPGVGLDGSVARLTLPPAASVCSKAGGRSTCPEVALALCTSGAAPDDVLALMTAGAGSVEASAAAARVAAAGIGTSLILPPFVLGRSFGLVDSASAASNASSFTGVQSEAAAAAAAVAVHLPLGRTWSPAQLAVTPSSFLQPLTAPPAPRSCVLSSSSPSLSSLRLVEPCSLVGNFLDPTTTNACTNVSDPLRTRCALGSGASCRPCPSDRALCPGGDALIPLPGYWVPTPASATETDVVACVGASPASRCPGGLSRHGLSRCGDVFQEGSFGCSVCAPGHYPSDEEAGACLVCPSGSSLANVAAIAAVLGWLLLGSLPFVAAVVWVTKRYHGSMRKGFLRGGQALLEVWGGLQILAQAAVVNDALPPATARLFARLQVLQFQGVAVHPLCSGDAGGALTGSIRSLAFALILLPVLAMLACAVAALGKQRLLEGAAASAAAPRRWLSLAGHHARRRAPLVLQGAAMVAFLLYGHTLGVAFKVTACSPPQAMPLLSYLALPTRDGSALAGAGMPFDLPTALACTGLPGAPPSATRPPPAQCAALQPYLLQPVQVSVMLGEVYTVCGEGQHVPAAALAVAAIVLFGAGLPLGALGFYWWRTTPSTVPALEADTMAAVNPLKARLSRGVGAFLQPLRSRLRRPRGVLTGGGGTAASVSAWRRALRVCAAPSGDAPRSADPLLRFFSRGPTREDRLSFFLLSTLTVQAFAALAAYASPPPTPAAAAASLAVSMLLLLSLLGYACFYSPFREAAQRPVAIASYALTCCVAGLSFACAMVPFTRGELAAAIAATPPDASAIEAARVKLAAYLADVQSLSVLVLVGAGLLGATIAYGFLEPLIAAAKRDALAAAEVLRRKSFRAEKVAAAAAAATGPPLPVTSAPASVPVPPRRQLAALLGTDDDALLGVNDAIASEAGIGTRLSAQIAAGADGEEARVGMRPTQASALRPATMARGGELASKRLRSASQAAEAAGEVVAPSPPPQQLAALGGGAAAAVTFSPPSRRDLLGARDPQPPPALNHHPAALARHLNAHARAPAPLLLLSSRRGMGHTAGTASSSAFVANPVLSGPGSSRRPAAAPAVAPGRPV